MSFMKLLRSKISITRPLPRVPVLLQMTDTECGAACLAMILGYYGHHISVTECRERFSIGRGGLNAQEIVQVARSYKLRVRSFSVNLFAFKQIALPAIVHWNFNHFIVVERFLPDKVEIVDPSIGRRTLTLDEYSSGFTGIVLTLEPSVQFERRKASPLYWADYLKQIFKISGVRGAFIQIVGTSLLLQFLGILAPIFTAFLVDQIIPFHIYNLMTILGVVLVMLLISQALTRYLRNNLLISLKAQVDAHMMLNFFEHMLSLPLVFFQRRNSGDLLMRLNSNTTLRDIFTGQALSILIDGALVILYLLVLSAQSPIFGLVVFVIGFAQVSVLFFTENILKRLTQEYLSTQSDAQGFMVESLSGISMLKSSGSEAAILAHWTDLFLKQLKVSLRIDQLHSLIDVFLTTLRNLSPLVLLWVTAYFVLDGTFTLGEMLASNALAIAFLTPLSSLVNTVQSLQGVNAYLDRIADVTKAVPEQFLEDIMISSPLSGHIELKNVSFRYTDQSPLIIDNISITIKPGQRVAIVGRTGAGKSTLAHLLLGLYKLTDGQILYDGHPLHTFDYGTLRKQFGVVLQESFLFSSSIRHNIAFNNPDLTYEEVIAASKIAAIHEEIGKMPMGYETPVSERGLALSGGQRQRISLARAVANKPALLILDEATSNLDVVTESKVQHNLAALNCTQIVIAHRLNTIRNADIIVVLDEGRIVEQGTHSELLSKGVYYPQLVQSQSAY
jgi:ATP-binding cassette subfamily B protein